MSKLEKSLNRLGESVGNLEAAIELMEETKLAIIPGQQQDMFANGAGQIVAKRLDKAIQNVENLLGEG